MEDKKVFGYPEFDADGVKQLTQCFGPYRDMMMDIHVFRMKRAGNYASNINADDETAYLLLEGEVTFEWEGNKKTVSRKDVFTEGPWCLHTSKDVKVGITAVSGNAELIIQSTPNDNHFPSKLYSPQDCPWRDVNRGKFGDTANRFVSDIFNYSNAPYSNMVLGEVMNDPGNWSGFIPHHHPQPEVYYFKFDRPEGFGASFVGDEVYKITDGSFSAIPGGKTHPQVAAPNYRMYTCWMIRHLPGEPWADRIDDERYVWQYEV